MKEISVTPTRLARGLAHAAVDTARHPVTAAARAAGLARGALHVARQAPGIVAGTIAGRKAEPDHASPEVLVTEPERLSAGDESPTTEQPVVGGVPDFEPPDPADRVLVVEAALAAEEGEPRYAGTTEPHAGSREEAHGEAGLARAELDELEEEAESRE